MKMSWRQVLALACVTASTVISTIADGIETLGVIIDADDDYQREREDWANAVREAIEELPEVENG